MNLVAAAVQRRPIFDGTKSAAASPRRLPYMTPMHAKNCVEAHCEQERRAPYVFSVRSAAVLGSSNVSTPVTPEIYPIPPALKPAPEDGRTPLNMYRAPARRGAAHPECADLEIGAPSARSIVSI